MIATKPVEVDQFFASALSAGDLAGALAMYEPDACYVSEDGSVARGHAQIREVLAALISQQPRLDCYEIDVVEQGEIALLRARWTYQGTNAAGEPFESQGRSIEVVRRQPDGSWLFVLDLPEGASS